MTRTPALLSALLLLTMMLGCEDKKTTPEATPPATSEDTSSSEEAPDSSPPAAQPESNKEEVKAPATDAKDVKEDSSKPDYAEQRAYEESLNKVKYDPKLHGGEGIPGYENKFEWDPSITADVQRVDTTGKLIYPDEGLSMNIAWDAEKDKMDKHVTWTDRGGTNMLVYTTQALKGNGMLLNAQIAFNEGSAWIVRRHFKELVETCEFDLVTETHLDPTWAIKDIDGDGHAEVTMAWTVDCTSDVSPNKHKVIIYSGDKKYALRGVTKVNPGGGAIGGEYKADPAFDKAPKGFLEHAKMVWDKTSTTTP